MELKQCDRCKKTINDEAEIGVALQMFTIIPDRGYIRPSQKLATTKLIGFIAM